MHEAAASYLHNKTYYHNYRSRSHVDLIFPAA